MSIDNNAIINTSCDNVSHIYNSVNTAISEFNDDVQVFKNKNLTDSSNIFPSNVVNNVPNATNNGSFPVWYGGTYTIGGDTSIRMGQNAGLTNFKDHSIALGTNAGRHEAGTASVAIGFNTGRTHSGTYSISIGYVAGNLTQGESSVAIGNGAGKNKQADWCVAIGNATGSTGQLNNSVAIGPACGNFNQGTNSVAIGVFAGYTAQGENCIAIGNQAGMTAQPNNSIVLNASGNPLSGNTSSAFFVDPVRNTITGSNVMCYDTTNKEISYSSNISLSNPLTVTQGSATLPSINFQGDSNTGIYSSAADTINFSTGGINRMNISPNGYLNLFGGQLLLPSGAVSTPSLSWPGNSSNTGIYLPSEDVIGVSCNGNLRASFGASAITFATSLYLPTSSGTPSPLDFYQELTHTSGWNFGSTNSNVQSGNFRFTRIGKMVTMTITYDWSAALTMGDAGGGTAIMNTAVISVFRPSQTLSFIGFAQVGGTNTTVRILQNSSGTTEITPLAGGNFANGTTLRLWTNSFSYSLT